MIRNDNGDLAGYIYVYLDGVTAPGVRGAGAGVPANKAHAAAGLLDGVDRAVSVRRGRALDAARSSCRSRWRSCSSCWSRRSGPSPTASLIMLSAPFALVGGVLLQWYLGYSMTTAVIIGYVSLFAVAIQTGIIMIEFIREALARRPADADLHGCGRRRLCRPAAAEADDRRDDGAGTAADHVRHRLGHGHHQADCHANVRRDDHLDDLRAVSDSVPVCHRCRHSRSLA